MVDDHEADFIVRHEGLEFVDLARADERRRSRRRNRHQKAVHDIEIDRTRQTTRFIQPVFGRMLRGRVTRRLEYRNEDKRTRRRRPGFFGRASPCLQGTPLAREGVVVVLWRLLQPMPSPS